MPADARQTPQTHHQITLETRSRLTISGVEEVERFDEEQIVMATAAGTLIIRGSSLHIDRLCLDGGDLKVTGRVDSLVHEQGRDRQGLLARLWS